jgi:hypothetical protein
MLALQNLQLLQINYVVEVSGAHTKVLYFSVKGRRFQLKQFREPFIIVVSAKGIKIFKNKSLL